MPIPVAERSEAWVCGLSHAGITGSNPGWSINVFSCEYYDVSGRDLCLGMIIRPEES